MTENEERMQRLMVLVIDIITKSITGEHSQSDRRVLWTWRRGIE